jgi:hypothetical protein
MQGRAAASAWHVTLGSNRAYLSHKTFSFTAPAIVFHFVAAALQKIAT